MARAPYNRDTLAFLRAATAAGKGIHTIAREIEWTVGELRQVASRHEILLIEDDPANLREAKPRPAPKLASAAAEVVIDKKRLSRVAIPQHPRKIKLVMTLSESAMTNLRELGEHHQKELGGLIGVVADHALRHRKIEALTNEALNELAEYDQ